jgi:hypothetical protein
VTDSAPSAHVAGSKPLRKCKCMRSGDSKKTLKKGLKTKAPPKLGGQLNAWFPGSSKVTDDFYRVSYAKSEGKKRRKKGHRAKPKRTPFFALMPGPTPLYDGTGDLQPRGWVWGSLKQVPKKPKHRKKYRLTYPKKGHVRLNVGQMKMMPDELNPSTPTPYVFVWNVVTVNDSRHQALDYVVRQHKGKETEVVGFPKSVQYGPTAEDGRSVRTRLKASGWIRLDRLKKPKAVSSVLGCLQTCSAAVDAKRVRTPVKPARYLIGQNPNARKYPKKVYDILKSEHSRAFLTPRLIDRPRSALVRDRGNYDVSGKKQPWAFLFFNLPVITCTKAKHKDSKEAWAVKTGGYAADIFPINTPVFACRGRDTGGRSGVKLPLYETGKKRRKKSPKELVYRYVCIEYQQTATTKVKRYGWMADAALRPIIQAKK